MHAVGVKHTQEYIKSRYVLVVPYHTLQRRSVPCRASTSENEGMTKRREDGSREVMLRKPPDFIRSLSIKSEKVERKQGGGAG